MPGTYYGGLLCRSSAWLFNWIIPPYTWPKEAEDAFVKYIEEGRGGWIGFHHATLLGEFDGYPTVAMVL